MTAPHQHQPPKNSLNPAGLCRAVESQRFPDKAIGDGPRTVLHSALVRGEDGGLHVRRFPTPALAREASRHREVVPPLAPWATPAPDELARVAGPARGEVSSTEFARRLKIHPRTVRRWFSAGGLPGAREHGPRTLRVPLRLLRLAQCYGLRRVVAWGKEGLLP